MKLDINTPRGQSALGYERDCIELFCKLYPDYKFLETDKREPAAIDGFFYLHKNQWVDCAVEVKTRDMTTEQLVCNYGNEWLISHDKVLRGQRISELICCPFIGMLYLIPEKKILTIKITDKRGNYIIDFDVRETATSKSINDHNMELGMNAFIPMEKAKEHKWSTEQTANSATTQ
tara:strand:- start:162 stop:689 length:528 start_codon:yes stop_codon:yes gene_type:complete